MSDDICSKCNDLTCPFYGYPDNCYRNSIMNKNSAVSTEDKVYLEEIAKKPDSHHEKTNKDDSRQISDSEQRILDLISRE